MSAIVFDAVEGGQKCQRCSVVILASEPPEALIAHVCEPLPMSESEYLGDVATEAGRKFKTLFEDTVAKHPIGPGAIIDTMYKTISMPGVERGEPDGMTELDALHWLMERGASIARCDGAAVNPFTGERTRAKGVLITCGTAKLWAPSITDAALMLRSEAGPIPQPKRAG
jgi:hypothetical protein